MRLRQAVIAVITGDKRGKIAARGVRFGDLDLLEDELQIVLNKIDHDPLQGLLGARRR